jgi:transposase
LEGQCQLHLAQAHSNRARKGRKDDFRDALRLARRHLAGELILSFVPHPEQRLWRTLTRSKHQLTRDRVRLHGQLEALLEDGRIKLAACVTDLLGVSSRRMMERLADGETDPAQLAALAEPELRASAEELADALGAAREMSALHRMILRLFLDRLALIERQREVLERSLAASMKSHHAAVVRLAAVPGLGADSAHQIVAEVGPEAVTFNSPGELASWVGVCPGREESAEVSKSDQSPKGNRTMRRILNQAANAARKTKGSIFQALYRRWIARLGHNRTIWAIAHRLCRVVWIILHRGEEYIEFGNQRDPKIAEKRTARLIRKLRSLGYQITAPAPLPKVAR